MNFMRSMKFGVSTLLNCNCCWRLVVSWISILYLHYLYVKLLFTVCITVFRHLLWCDIHQNKVLCTVQLHIWYMCNKWWILLHKWSTFSSGLCFCWLVSVGIVRTGVLYVFPPTGLDLCTIFEVVVDAVYPTCMALLFSFSFWDVIQEAYHFGWIELVCRCSFCWWLLCSFLKHICL
jgi:hypothetical protein